MITKLKECKDCKNTYPITLIYWFSRGGKRANELETARCKECSRIRRRLNNKKNKEYFIKYREAHKVENSKYQKDYFVKNKSKISERNKKYRLSIKIEVLTHYSKGIPKCECCDERYLEFLGIDHINGGGKKDRVNYKGGSRFYYYLKKNDYPEGHRVLCQNCNLSLGVFGYCPHKKFRIQPL